MNGLSFTARWASAVGDDPVLSTRGSVIARLDGEVVWGSASGGFDWTWIDFLEHVARVWPRLLWQPMPFNVPPDSVGSAPALVREALAGLDPDELEVAEEEAFSFLESHDLAHSIAGARLPSLWLVTEGGRVAVATSTSQRWVSVAESVGIVERFCAEIVTRLSGSDHPRARAAVQAWSERHRSSDDLVTLFTGWAPDELAALGSHVSATARVENSGVLALARAVRGLMPARELKLVLDQTRRPARSPARPPRFVDGVEGAPFEQGFALAAQVRAKLGLDGPVDPEALLKRWGVRVFTADLRLSRHIDALAMWKGSSAWVVVNGAGHHAQSRVGRRATLAHEICHVLFDSGGALPLVEALGGRMPRDLEQRARAFAAELLLPRGLIAGQYDGDALATVRRAANRFGVSKELAAWQLRNSGVELDAVQRKALKGLVSRPQQF